MFKCSIFYVCFEKNKKSGKKKLKISSFFIKIRKQDIIVIREKKSKTNQDKNVSLKIYNFSEI